MLWIKIAAYIPELDEYRLLPVIFRSEESYELFVSQFIAFHPEYAAFADNNVIRYSNLKVALIRATQDYPMLLPKALVEFPLWHQVLQTLE